MSQLPFSGMSGFSPPVQSPDYYETKSIFAFRVKLKGSLLHSKLTNQACQRKLTACDGKCNSCFQLHLTVLKEVWVKSQTYVVGNSPIKCGVAVLAEGTLLTCSKVRHTQKQS